MVTPFHDSGAVDHQAAHELARHLAEQGSDALLVAGTTGESPTLSDNEKIALFKTIIDAVSRKKTKVIVGTGTYDTAHSVELTAEAKELGADGVLAVTPYYNKPSQRGLVAHFSAMADVGIPVMLYNIPGRTGRRIEVETLVELASHPNIVGVKDAVLDLEFTSSTINQAPSFAVYSGQDSLNLPMMSVGAVGAVSVISHLAGPTLKAMLQAVGSGDYEKAGRLHHQLLPLCLACFLEASPAPVKGALSRVWQPVGEVRLPLVPASEDTLVEVEKAIGAISGS